MRRVLVLCFITLISYAIHGESEDPLHQMRARYQKRFFGPYIRNMIDDWQEQLADSVMPQEPVTRHNPFAGTVAKLPIGSPFN